jgi:integrase
MKKRRANGEGSIYRHRDLWCGEIIIGGKRKSVYGKTQADARKKLDALKNKTVETANEGTARQTLSVYLEAWLENDVRSTVRLATFKLTRMVVRRHIIPAVGSVVLGDLTAQHVQTMMGELERSQKSARLRQVIHAVLSRAVRRAVELEVIPKNPCDRVKRPRSPRPNIYAMTNEQRSAFLTAAKSDRHFALYHVALATGLRQGELLALQWGDVDLKNGRVAVRYTLTLDENGALVRTDTKTGTGRVVELATESVSALKKHQERLMADGLRASPWVFPDTEGGPIRKDNLVKRSFQELLTVAGLPHFRFHDLRHSYASLALSAGVHPKVVQDTLGHASIKMTLDTYSHLMPSMQREAADLIGKLLG